MLLGDKGKIKVKGVYGGALRWQQVEGATVLGDPGYGGDIWRRKKRRFDLPGMVTLIFGGILQWNYVSTVRG